VPTTGFTKRQMKELRRLADEAYRRELDAALREVAAAFGEWEAGKLSGFALSDRIHEFHNGIARDLWHNYNYVPTPKRSSASGRPRSANTFRLPSSTRIP
jgi:hydroxypyruvate isomerase